MANPKGNPGNRGGGRKSAYQEQADAKELWKMFFGDQTKEQIEEKISTGKFSVKDMFMKKALEGNERLMADMFKKLFPDLEKAEHSGGIEISIVDYERPADTDSTQLRPDGAPVPAPGASESGEV